MTFLPKSELVGVLAPSSINTKDVGTRWYDIGAILTANFITYLGNGIVIAGNGLGHIYRSTDYGNRWNDTGAISGGNFQCSTYLGNGIVLAGDSIGHIWRNINFGNNGISGSPTAEWVDQGAVAGANSINCISYLGNGIVIFGTSNGHVFRHINYGDTAVSAWVDLGVVSVSPFERSTYLENGIILIHDNNGRLFRSTNYGANWTNLGTVAVTLIGSTTYCGNGIAILTVSDAVPSVIWRSVDYGATWNSVVGSGVTNAVAASSYLGNGIVIIGKADGHVWRSTNFGLTFTDLGDITGAGNAIRLSEYLDNGIAIISDSSGEFFRSDASYKVNEGQANYPRVPTVDLGPSGTNIRALNTTYTNLDYTRSLMIIATIECAGGAGGGSAIVELDIGTVSPPITPQSFTGLTTGLINENNLFVIVGIVRPRYNYRLISGLTGTGGVSLQSWIETYI